MSRDVAVLIRFTADGRMRAYPITDAWEDGPLLAERVRELCEELLRNPDALHCIAGWHEHPGGTCWRR